MPSQGALSWLAPATGALRCAERPSLGYPRTLYVYTCTCIVCVFICASNIYTFLWVCIHRNTILPMPFDPMYVFMHPMYVFMYPMYVFMYSMYVFMYSMLGEHAGHSAPRSHRDLPPRPGVCACVGMCVCVQALVCVCVYVYALLTLRVCVCVYIHMGVCVQGEALVWEALLTGCMYTTEATHLHVALLYVATYMYTHSVHLYTCMYRFGIDICMYIYMYVYIWKHTHSCICICVCRSVSPTAHSMP